jgi:hypothetical protein
MCIYALEQDVDLSKIIELQKNDIRSGTGWLQYAPVGIKLTVNNILYLILAESDNTATNCLVRILGGPEIIDNWLKTKTKTTRLELPKGSKDKFCYGFTNPAEITELFDELLAYSIAEDYLKRNRFDWGLKNQIDKSKQSCTTQAKSMLFIKINKRLGKKISRILLANKRAPSKYPNKDGSWQRCRHEVAKVNGYTVAILTEGFDKDLPYDHNHPAFKIFKEIGKILEQ